MKDDQDKTLPSNMSASDTWVTRPVPPSAQPGQAAPDETLLSQPSWSLADQPTNLLQPQPSTPRSSLPQPPTPQSSAPLQQQPIPRSSLPLQPKPQPSVPLQQPPTPQTSIPPQPFAETSGGGLAPSRPRKRRWFGSRPGRIVVPLLTLLLGIILGLSLILWYGWALGGSSTITPSSAPGNLIVQANKVFVTQLVTNNLSKAGLPGQVENVNVDMDHGPKMIITGDDVTSVLGLSFTRHFTVNVQPYVDSCILQIRVLSADLGGIPVTGFVQAFQGTINSQLSQKPSGLPSGFVYCAVGVRVAPTGMTITYQTIPIK